MYVSWIETNGFRNLKGQLEVSPNLNFIVGENGQGKTNWLEAIAIVGNTKSFRTHHLQETLHFGSDQTYIKANVVHRSRTEILEVHLGKSQKQLLSNGKRTSINEYLGKLDVFVYCQQGMDIIRGDPSARRRFLDKGVVSLRPHYIQVIADYNRVLKQKNVLLKQTKSNKDTMSQNLLDVWDIELVEYGVTLHQARIDYVNRLNQVLLNNFFDSEDILIRYKSSLQNSEDSQYKDLFTNSLTINRNKEIAIGHAVVGPHRDDLEILLNGYEISRYGSAGQQRSALLVLELAQLAIYEAEFRDHPIFLLDDIDAELDMKRISKLINFLDDKTQTFITTSKLQLAEEYKNKACLNWISNGFLTKV